MKQTAVEWMVEQLRMQTPLYTKDEIINEAKEMEKKQIVDTARYYFHEVGKLTPEEYYNQQFKNK